MYSINQYNKVLDKVLPEGSAEYELVVEVYNLLTSQLPTTSSGAYARLSSLDSVRPQVSALVFSLTNSVIKLNQEHSVKYYPVYTRWAVAGTKRSHAEIEAQIYRDDPELLLLRSRIDEYNNALEFVKSLLRSIDSSRSSAVESWRDSNRYS